MDSDGPQEDKMKSPETKSPGRKRAKRSESVEDSVSDVQAAVEDGETAPTKDEAMHDAPKGDTGSDNVDVESVAPASVEQKPDDVERLPTTPETTDVQHVLANVEASPIPTKVMQEESADAEEASLTADTEMQEEKAGIEKDSLTADMDMLEEKVDTEKVLTVPASVIEEEKTTIEVAKVDEVMSLESITNMHEIGEETKELPKSLAADVQQEKADADNILDTSAADLQEVRDDERMTLETSAADVQEERLDSNKVFEEPAADVQYEKDDAEKGPKALVADIQEEKAHEERGLETPATDIHEEKDSVEKILETSVTDFMQEGEACVDDVSEIPAATIIPGEKAGEVHVVSVQTSEIQITDLEAEKPLVGEAVALPVSDVSSELDAEQIVECYKEDHSKAGEKIPSNEVDVVMQGANDIEVAHEIDAEMQVCSEVLDFKVVAAESEVIKEADVKPEMEVEFKEAFEATSIVSSDNLKDEEAALTHELPEAGEKVVIESQVESKLEVVEKFIYESGEPSNGILDVNKDAEKIVLDTNLTDCQEVERMTLEPLMEKEEQERPSTEHPSPLKAEHIKEKSPSELANSPVPLSVGNQ
ncbi:hypothetical protein KP509_14G023800 [Ceratopteris richardii]|nr:hypothetical protein KP509_14G023800 [Ceratopteris richardii]KAH7415017.1 hypothetical protein KP509_14G023800 [Ceratopteris richardii]KAH7415018.1 hypothetical protein KP509_14G023800 [Ceratopteris richardii]KAH7415019.1 hypothetical protein KP509_14G023800 [Ceratopteris richardii]KAH7415020.1 hypothetical protein KP509_14G023800 [Ceratopteris richardii]